jgi:hypothetical protein
MTTVWDKLHGSSPSSTPPSENEENFWSMAAIRMAIMGVAVSPQTEIDPDSGRIMCACRRSPEYAKGCTICWSVDIGNLRTDIIRQSGRWRMFVEPFLDQMLRESVIPMIASTESIVEIKSQLRPWKCLLNKIASLVFRQPAALWSGLVSGIELERVLQISSTPFLELLVRIFEFELLEVLSGRETVSVEVKRLVNESEAKIARYNQILLDKNPSLLLESTRTEASHAVAHPVELNAHIETRIEAELLLEDLLKAALEHTKSFSKPKKRPIDSLLYESSDVIASARTATETPRITTPLPHAPSVETEQRVTSLPIHLPPIYVMHVVRDEIDRIAEKLGVQSIDIRYPEWICQQHEVLLLHSANLVETLCVEALDAYYLSNSEESLGELVSQGIQGKRSDFAIKFDGNNSVLKSSNIPDLLDGLRFPNISFESIYLDAFKLLLSVEYGLHSLERCWTVLKDAPQVLEIWRSLRLHLLSIFQYLRMIGVEANQRQLVENLKRAKSLDDQIQSHAVFIELLERDLFLKPAGKPFRRAIYKLARLAISFRAIVDRSVAFGRHEDDILFELNHVNQDLTNAIVFLRNNLKHSIWSFIS